MLVCTALFAALAFMVLKLNSTKLSTKEILPLIAVTVAAFVFNTSEFMPVGLLTDIGASFQTSEGQTGLIVSVYAWAVMILSLPLMMAASRVPFRPLLLSVLIVFSAGQVLSALASSYGMLMAARLVVACAHSVFWAIAAPLAVKVVDELHAPLAISAVETGTALAMVAGLPLGRVIGLLLGWRLTFACVGMVSFVVLLYTFFVFPKVSGAKAFKVKQLPEIFSNKMLVGIFVITALYAMGYYTGYSYIEPFLLQVGSMSESVVTLVLVVFGVAGMFASVLCAKYYMRHRKLFVWGCIAGVGLSLLLLRIGAFYLPLILLICCMWGICGAVYSIVYQAEIIRFARSGQETVAMAIFSGIFNLGIGTGSFIGGGVCTYIGVWAVGFVGAVIVAIGLAYCVFRFKLDT